MPAASSNIIEFPITRRREMPSCPHCGTCTGTLRLGRVMWAYCEQHQMRWVAADFLASTPDSLDRQQFRRGLEYLLSFVEVSL